jgi:murein DD-endopeptidase MepM/ murein hydrolase activator NlpD
LVANGLFSATDGLGKGLSKTQKTLGKSINSATTTIASATVGSGKAVVHGAAVSAAAVASAVGTSSSFVADTTGDIIGFVADAPVVTSIIRPADNISAPSIDPNTPIVAAKPDKKTEKTGGQSVAVAAADTKPQWPIHGAITTEFGVPHWPFQPTHTGIDISDGKPSGITPIHPFEPGIVKDVIQSSVGFGNHVIVDHGNGLISLYGHMYKTSVKVGQKVDQKTVLGFEGTTGASTGPHVHFELQLNGVPVDPHKYVDGSP